MRKAAKVTFARALRKRPTDAETHLWFFLRRRQLHGFRFRRQHSVGPYIVDFICLESALVIELDGGQHVGCVQDVARDVWLGENGYRVLRFWNDDALMRTDAVLGMIVSKLSASPAHPAGDGNPLVAHLPGT